MLPPKLNITSTGSVPTHLQTFSVTLSCSGTAAGEVNVTITLNITISHTNVTTLTFRRKKICTKVEMHSNNHVFIDTLPTDSNSANIFYIAIASAVVLVVVLSTVVTMYYMKNKKTGGSTECNSGPTTTFLTAIPRDTVITSYGSFRRMPSYSLTTDERSKNLQKRISELTVQRYIVVTCVVLFSALRFFIYYFSE